MARELVANYETSDYPVEVCFVERKRDNSMISDWVVRKEDAEFIIVNNGELTVYCEDNSYRVLAGQGLLININVEHRVSSSAIEDTAFYSVVFSPNYVIKLDNNNSLVQKYFTDIMSSKKRPCRVLDETNLMDESVIDKINSVIVANTIKKPGYEILTKGYLCMLWVALLEMYGDDVGFNGRNVPSQDELRAKSAVTYMQDNYADYITLEDIAAKIHVSRNECCRCFKRVIGMSPVDYLIKLRIYHSAKILMKAPLSVSSVSELAITVGFNNVSYFNRMFKRYMECTPSEYIKLLKDNPNRASQLYDSLQEMVTGII